MAPSFFCTAIVTVSSGTMLDYENEMEIEVFVEAYDAATPSLTSTVTLTIYVQDVNDVAPQFELSQYAMNIPENSPNGTELITINANDPDTGEGGTVRYFITGASPLLAFEEFAISETTGL